MTDRKKIMNDFEHEVNKAHGEGWDFVDLSTDDAKKILVLLKEQETIFERDGHHIRCTHCNSWWCNTDREGNAFPTNYCPECGRRVKWDDSDRNGNG